MKTNHAACTDHGEPRAARRRRRANARATRRPSSEGARAGGGAAPNGRTPSHHGRATPMPATSRQADELPRGPSRTFSPPSLASDGRQLVLILIPDRQPELITSLSQLLLVFNLQIRNRALAPFVDLLPWSFSSLSEPKNRLVVSIHISPSPFPARPCVSGAGTRHRRRRSACLPPLHAAGRVRATPRHTAARTRAACPCWSSSRRASPPAGLAAAGNAAPRRRPRPWWPQRGCAAVLSLFLCQMFLVYFV